MKRLLCIVVLPFTIAFLHGSCKKDEQATGTDKELYDMAKVTSGFTWYKYSDELLDKSSGSGHNFPFLRTRFNETAAAYLDSTGKVIDGTVYPEGSLVVKELYENANTLSRYAVLDKKPGHDDADANGWVWGYINADESIAEPASNRGDACISCHQQNGNIDYILMNKFFP